QEFTESRYEARQEAIDEGSKIALIKDPFGLTGKPEFLGATTPILRGFADSLALSPDGRKLYAGFRGVIDEEGASGVILFDVSKLENVGESNQDDRVKTPLDKLDSRVR